jgi:cyclophilin family peptidyl-prolyl cis-trans isomerase/HEAT repeat protein
MKYSVLLAVTLLLSCTSSNKDVNKFADAELVRIYEWQDRRVTDSLVLYLSHNQAQYRKEAALAFASVQDTAAAEKLGRLLLDDSDEGVRQVAAVALGQSPCRSSIEALSAALKQEKNQTVLKYVLEALGNTLPDDSTTVLTAYETVSNESEEGKAWGVYKLGLRGIVHEDVINTALKGLLSTNRNTRLASSHFFARTSLKDFADKGNVLQGASYDPDVAIRIAATLALRQVKTDSSRIILQQRVKDNDERVRVSALRALRVFPFDLTAEAYLKALNDTSHQVRVASAETILGVATAGYAGAIYQAAKRVVDWRVQTTLFETVAKLQPSDTLFEEVENRYITSTNNYQKAALLSVLGRSAANYSFVGNELAVSNDPIVLSSAALSLGSCNQAEDFRDSQKPAFLALYKKAIERGDAAVTGIIAQILGDSTKQYKPLLTDITFLKVARDKLSLPKDNEAIQPVEAAIAYLEGHQPPEVKNSYNHPIDWELVRSIPANQKAVIQTTQGDITLLLFIEESPGSVANFITLTRQGYFNGKFFHRVVPNFVIQAGCARGDGWGSEDYSIRSEFTTGSYKEGSVGMASAGKDTEGTQWFITHSPTPHLNGRYTIFAEVIKGMDVVNKIGVGDRIIDARLQEDTRNE